MDVDRPVLLSLALSFSSVGDSLCIMSTYKNFSADLAKDVERSKKDKRLESKKKKALAFLKLIEMKQEVSHYIVHRSLDLDAHNI